MGQRFVKCCSYYLPLSPIHMNCIKPKIFAIWSILEKLAYYKNIVWKRKKIRLFLCKMLSFISGLLGLGGAK